MKAKIPAIRTRSSSVLLLFVAIGTGCFGAGCGGQEKEQEPVASVQVTPVRKAAIAENVAAEGVVFPVQQAVVMPKITAPIKEFLVQRGARVHKGQLLAILENADLSAAAAESKGEFEQAEAGYSTTTRASLPQQIQKAELDASSAKVALDAQQKVYDSRKELFQQGALPRRDLDAAEVSLAQARSLFETAQRQLADLKSIGEKDTLKSASGQLTAALGKYQGAAAQLSYSEIRSPMNGIVTDRPQYAGELATANQPLLTIMDTSRLIAKSHISQSEAAVITVGNQAAIRLPGVEDPIEGHVSLVSPALDPGSTTIEVWVEATKPDPALKPGMSVQLNITGRSAKESLVIPASAIFKNDEGAEYVALAAADSHAELRTVQTGIRNSALVQITSGLNEGDSVITSGGYALPDKTKIKVESSPAKDSGANPENGSRQDKE